MKVRDAHRRAEQLHPQSCVLQCNLPAQENPTWLVQSLKQLGLHFCIIFHTIALRGGLGFFNPTMEKTHPLAALRCWCMCRVLRRLTQSRQSSSFWRMNYLQDTLHLQPGRSFHLDRVQSSPHRAAQWPAGVTVTEINPSLQGSSSFALVRKSIYIHNYLGTLSTVKPRPLPFFAGFLLLFSCPLTSCNRFSSSFFFSWANSSFDFAACFFPLAAVEEERTISETAWLQVKNRVDIAILQGM